MSAANVISIDAVRQQRCHQCGVRTPALIDVFENSQGWLRKCSRCAASPTIGRPEAYTGPYPIR